MRGDNKLLNPLQLPAQREAENSPVLQLDCERRDPSRFQGNPESFESVGIFLTKQPRSCWLLLGLCGRISQETLGGRMQSPVYDLEHLLYAYNTSECHMGILNMH